MTEILCFYECSVGKPKINRAFEKQRSGIYEIKRLLIKEGVKRLRWDSYASGNSLMAYFVKDRKVNVRRK
jgi:hypothetical protein